jgi:hypothetical protein
MRRAFTFLCAVFAAAATGRAAGGDGVNDVLRFVDGSMLHGQLKQLDFEHGLVWQHPAATAPIDFQTGRVDAVRFGHSSSLKLTPTCHVRFANGDDLFGSLESLDTDHVRLATWFGDELNVPRSGLRSVTFLSKNFTILYEGPYDTEGWVITSNDGAGGGWRYSDRGFTATGRGFLGRQLHLNGSCTVEFDLTWADFLGLAIAFYTGTPDRLDFNVSSYLAQFSRGRVTLQRLRAAAIPRNLGTSPPVPALETPGTTRIALQFNKEESEMELLVNGELVKQWKDEDGFSVTGGCIIFEQTIPNFMARISHLRVSSWEGRYEPETTASVTNVDVLRFINHDRAGGKIQEIKDGKVTVELAPGVLAVPLERLTQIDFAAVPGAVADAPSRSTVRAFFPGGGSLSFELEHWSNNIVEGHSAIFGRLAFQPNGIRELQFNLDRPRAERGESPVNEFEGLNE